MKMWIVDAFTNGPFSGNPAAVCLLDQASDATWMQAVAAEMNLSETAFVVPAAQGFDLRWFTPGLEVDLCGHATLASAHVLWSEGLVPNQQTISFFTRSGVLLCDQHGAQIQLNFPATPPQPTVPPDTLIDALGVQPKYCAASKFDSFLVLESETQLLELRPDFRLMKETPVRGVIATAVSDRPEFDFVSRFFAPMAGIDEDPVTGSAHCCLAPYWAEQFGKTELRALQASQRTGVLGLTVQGDRVLLRGTASTFMRGTLVAR